MQTKLLFPALSFGLVLLSQTLSAQLIVTGKQNYKLSAASFTRSAAGVVVSATIAPVPSDSTKLNLAIFAPTANGASLSQLNVAGGSYAMTMDEAGDYFNFDLKTEKGAGKEVGPLIIHELRKGELSNGNLKLLLRHRLAVRANEPFPTSGQLEIAIAIEGKGPGGDPQFTIVSNSLAGTTEDFAALSLRPGSLFLGVSDGTPLVYCKPAAGLTLVLSQTAYDDFGQAMSYTLELGLASSPKLTVLVSRTSEAKANPVKFIARAGAHTLVELSTAKTKDELVALNPADAGGVVLAAPGELTENVTTEFAYDNFGRQQVAAQSFVHAGAKWKVTFSDYTRDGIGRLTGCQARISKAE